MPRPHILQKLIAWLKNHKKGEPLPADLEQYVATLKPCEGLTQEDIDNLPRIDLHHEN